MTGPMRMRPVLLLDVVRLTPALLEHMPALRGLSGTRARLDTVLPAVTCTVQSTLLTRAGAPRARHRRQRLVLRGAGRGAAVAPAQPAGHRGEAVGDRPQV